MSGIMRFAVVAGATIASLQAAGWALDAMNIAPAEGFGLDDVIEGVLVALGVSLTLSIARPLLKAV